MSGAAQGAFARTGEVWQRAAVAWREKMMRFTADLSVAAMTKLHQKWLTSAAEDYAG